MLNKERIRLMTKMASYEVGEGKEYIPIKQYYRRDYLSLQMLKTFVTSSIAFGCDLLVWRLAIPFTRGTERNSKKFYDG